MKSTYLFEIDNFGFRPVIESDTDNIAMLGTDPEIMSFFPGGAQSREKVSERVKVYIEDYKKRGYGIFVVYEIDSGEFIGRAGFADVESGETEVGYLILKKYWGKGYGTRILKALLTWAKDHIHKDKIIAFTPIAHTASEKVMQKAGMVFSKKCVMMGVECVLYEYQL